MLLFNVLLILIPQDAVKNQGSKDPSGLIRQINDDMSVSKTRQFSLQINPKSGLEAIFHHVDCSKLPQDPESTKNETSVNGGNLLAAMFGTADEDEDDLNGDTP